MLLFCPLLQYTQYFSLNYGEWEWIYDVETMRIYYHPAYMSGSDINKEKKTLL